MDTLRLYNKLPSLLDFAAMQGRFALWAENRTPVSACKTKCFLTYSSCVLESVLIG